MTAPTPALADTALRFNRLCLAAAFGVTLLWGAIYIGANGPGLVDEPGQLDAIRHFAATRPGIPDALPNLPGYHFLVLWLTPSPPTLTSARLVTLGFALAGLVAFAGAWQRWHGQHPGGATLLFALLPLLQPYTAMVYTDGPALTFLLAACWTQFAGRRGWAAILLTLACLIRQTSVIWAGYLLLLEAAVLFFPPGRDRDGSARLPWSATLLLWLERGRWLLLLLGVATATILHAGRFTLGTAHGNQLEPNIATLHFAGCLLLLLGLPYWLARSGPMVRTWISGVRQRPARYGTATIALLGLAAALAATYRNNHIWNRELFWLDAPSTFTLLRNWPLIGIDRVPLLRVLSGLVIVGGGAGLAYCFARQPGRRELWLLLPFTAALLLSNGLVEPRYLIQPCALALLFLRPQGPLLPWQLRWFAVLCLVQAPFVLTGLALW